MQDLKRPENLKVEPDHKRLRVEAVGARCSVPRKRCQGAARGGTWPVRISSCMPCAVLLPGQKIGGPPNTWWVTPWHCCCTPVPACSGYTFTLSSFAADNSCTWDLTPAEARLPQGASQPQPDSNTRHLLDKAQGGKGQGAAVAETVEGGGAADAVEGEGIAGAAQVPVRQSRQLQGAKRKNAAAPLPTTNSTRGNGVVASLDLQVDQVCSRKGHAGGSRWQSASNSTHACCLEPRHMMFADAPPRLRTVQVPDEVYIVLSTFYFITADRFPLYALLLDRHIRVSPLRRGAMLALYHTPSCFKLALQHNMQRTPFLPPNHQATLGSDAATAAAAAAASVVQWHRALGVTQHILYVRPDVMEPLLRQPHIRAWTQKGALLLVLWRLEVRHAEALHSAA